MLFGPQGVGRRSVLAAAARHRHIKTVDLATVDGDPVERRAAALRMWGEPVHGVEMYLAADLREHDVPTSGFETVLILPSQAEYVRRYESCRRARPGERFLHSPVDFWRAFKGAVPRYDRAIRADLSVKDTVDAVLEPYDTSVYGRYKGTSDGAAGPGLGIDSDSFPSDSVEHPAPSAPPMPSAPYAPPAPTAPYLSDV